MNIKIDPEFRDLIPPLSDDELDNLHKSISLDGLLSPLIVWKQEGILLDGHNRYAFCKKCDYDFQVTEIKLPHRDAAIDWIILNQLGRRNVSPDTAAKLRGMLYICRKKEHGGDRKNEESSGQSGHLIDERKTRDVVAKETGVSARTIARDAAYAEACDKLGITTAAIASGGEKRSRKEIIATARPDKAKPKKTKAPEPAPEPITDDDDDVQCLVVDATGESPWPIMLNLLPKFKTTELQKLHDLLETDFGCHPAAASNEGRAS